MGPITYFFGAIGIVATYLYPAIYGKDINPKKHFETKESEINTSVFAEFNFDLERFDELQTERDKLKNEIEEIKTLHNNTYKQ
jgi:hypothetical protein